MQVHEIGRKALEQLIEGGRLHDSCRGHGDYCVVYGAVRFGKYPSNFVITENFETMYWACHSAEDMNTGSLNLCKHGSPFCLFYEVWHIVDDSDWVILWGFQDNPSEWTNESGEHLQALFPDDGKALRFAYAAVAQSHCDYVVINGIHGYYCVTESDERTSLIVEIEKKTSNSYSAVNEVKRASIFYKISFVLTQNVKKKYICPECDYDCVVM